MSKVHFFMEYAKKGYSTHDLYMLYIGAIDATLNSDISNKQKIEHIRNLKASLDEAINYTINCAIG